MFAKEEIFNLRKQIRSDLITSFNELKKIGLIVGLVLAPWIPAYVVKVSIVDAHRLEVIQYANTSLGSVSGYIDSLFTLHQLCKEYNKNPIEERNNNEFQQRFNFYMGESLKWRAKLAANTITIKKYFGSETGHLTSQLMLLEAYYGFTPSEYCSRNLLSKEELIKIEEDFYQSAIKTSPFLQSNISLGFNLNHQQAYLNKVDK